MCTRSDILISETWNLISSLQVSMMENLSSFSFKNLRVISEISKTTNNERNWSTVTNFEESNFNDVRARRIVQVVQCREQRNGASMV